MNHLTWILKISSIITICVYRASVSPADLRQALYQLLSYCYDKSTLIKTTYTRKSLYQLALPEGWCPHGRAKTAGTASGS